MVRVDQDVTMLLVRVGRHVNLLLDEMKDVEIRGLRSDWSSEMACHEVRLHVVNHELRFRIVVSHVPDTHRAELTRFLKMQLSELESMSDAMIDLIDVDVEN